MFCQITEEFEEVMAVAVGSSPRRPRKMLHTWMSMMKDHSDEARDRYDGDWIRGGLMYDSPESISHLPYSDVLHIIVALFQSKPLTLKFLAMKKVLELDLEVGDLPKQLQVKAGEVVRLARLDPLLLINFFLRASSLALTRSFHSLTRKAGSY